MSEGFGARLRAQRERQQITLATIAERTKIRQAVFEALERDDVSRWPGGLFRRSYFRSYAAAIGLDPESAVREFLAVYPEPAEEQPDTPAEAESDQPGRAPRTRLHYLLASAIDAVSKSTLDAVSKPFDKERFDTRAPEVAPAAVSPGQGPDSPVRGAVDHVHAETDEDLGDFNGDPGDLDAESERASEIELESHAAVAEETPAVQVDLAALAHLSTRIVEAGSASDLEALLGEAARLLNAVGIIVWPWDQTRGVLVPSLSHGYPRQTLTRLPTVAPDAANPVGAAFRSSTRQIVASDGADTSAIVVPLTTTHGCVGVLAIEFVNSLEQDAAVQALATILAAQLSLPVHHVQHVQAAPASHHAIA